MNEPSLFAFVLACVVIEITPGPNMAYLTALSLSSGWRPGVAAVGGVALGLSIYGVAAALGLAALIDRSVVFYETLRWAGVGYLGWLAWQAWASEPESASATDAGLHDKLYPAFHRGLVTNLLNPKAAIFYIVVVPAFVRPSGGHLAIQTLTLSAIYVAIATAVHLAIVFLASRVRTVIVDPARRRLMRRSLAVMLIAITVWFAVSTGR